MAELYNGGMNNFGLEEILTRVRHPESNYRIKHYHHSSREEKSEDKHEPH